ncbi:MAG: putative 3-phenylpropionic acid transporter [Myxococcales bacterium]|nr:putative 3-phenylpropionic acid transporter [Myxococcales bacterium]
MADKAAAPAGEIADAPNNILFRFVTFFFLFGCLGGIITVYLPPYIKSLGFSSHRFGQLMAIPPLLTCFVPLIWAQLGDRFGIRLRLVQLMLFGLVATFTAFHFAVSGLAIAAALIGMAVFRAGVMPLADALALSNLSSRQYVGIIVANSLSWIVATTLFAYLASELPSVDHWAVRITHLMIAVTAVYSLVLVAKVQPVADRPKLDDGIALLRDRRIQLFLVSLMIYWTSMGPFETLLAIHTTEMGYGASAAGYAFSLAVLAEVLVLSFAKRFGFDLINMPKVDPARARHMMAIVMGATAVRWFLSSIAPNLPCFLALQLIHGLSFGAFILLAIGNLRVLVPEGLRATGQALLFSAMGGIGGVLGSLLAGAMHELGGSQLAFQVGGGVVVVALVFTHIASRFDGARAA